MALKHQDVTEAVIKAFYAVYNTLGPGFSERVYHRALAIELRHMSLAVVSEMPIAVFYRGESAGEFFADLVVNDCVVLELKAVKELTDEHEAQLLNYLKATRYEVGLLLNFGPEPKFERRAFDNSRKGSLAWLPQHAGL